MCNLVFVQIARILSANFVIYDVVNFAQICYNWCNRLLLLELLYNLLYFYIILLLAILKFNLWNNLANGFERQVIYELGNG